MQIVHIDMDMFLAAVEIRDNPELAGKPLIIGALPSERVVVSTCSYEARKFGVRSAMSIKEAYRLYPQGIYMHPNGHKYFEASRQIHKIWDDYTDLVEYISLRLVEISLSGFTDAEEKQLTLFDAPSESEKSGKLDEVTMNLQKNTELMSLNSEAK